MLSFYLGQWEEVYLHVLRTAVEPLGARAAAAGEEQYVSDVTLHADVTMLQYLSVSLLISPAFLGWEFWTSRACGAAARAGGGTVRLTRCAARMLFSYTVNGGFYVTVFITVLSLFTVVDFLRNVLVVHAHEVRDKVRARRTAARAGSRVDGVHPTRISSFARPAAVAGCRCFAAVPVDRHRRVRCSAARVSRLGCVARSHHMHMLLCWLIACHWQWGARSLDQHGAAAAGGVHSRSAALVHRYAGVACGGAGGRRHVWPPTHMCPRAHRSCSLRECPGCTSLGLRGP